MYLNGEVSLFWGFNEACDRVTLGPGEGGTPYNGINGEAPLERGTPFRFLKKAQQGYQMYRMAVEKSRKHSGFVITSHFKDSTFRDAKL